MGYKRPKAEKIPTPPPAPDAVDAAIQQAGAQERQRQRGLAGRRATFLSGALGDTSTVSTSVRSMLGS